MRKAPRRRAGVTANELTREPLQAKLGLGASTKEPVRCDMSGVVVATRYGGPDVLSVIDVPTPEPGRGEVRIAVRAAGVNPIDHKMYSGQLGADPAKLPLRLGNEAAGVVTAVGTHATGPAGPIAVGD